MKKAIKCLTKYNHFIKIQIQSDNSNAELRARRKDKDMYLR